MREEIERVLSRYASVELTYEAPFFLEYVVTSGSIGRSFDDVFRELVGLGYQPLLIMRSGQEVLRVFRVEVREARRTMAYALALATLAAVAVSGYFSTLSFHECLGGGGDPIVGSILAFVLAVLVPLSLHEWGHFQVSKRMGIPTPLPMFIPAPLVSPLGTFGAVITTRFLPRDRRSLAFLGLSGPLAGVAASLLLMVATLRLSPVVRPEELVCEVMPIRFIPISAYLLLALGAVPLAENEIILLHPAALASMLLLLIHFANLLPIGQLDGGHVVRSLSSMELHRAVSLAVPMLLVLLALLLPASYGWLGFFSILALLISGFRPHVGYSNQASELSPRDRVYVLAAYLALLLLTAPAPL